MLPGFIAGLVAEWLRRGLQILAPRFDSGRGLQHNQGLNSDPNGREQSAASLVSVRMEIEGPPIPQKRFLVLRDVDGSHVLASFDKLDEAIADVRLRRDDWRYIIMEIRTIVWPEDRVTRR
jgi:hypothetical protein